MKKASDEGHGGVPLVMALDGGGTKLACAVADAQGRLLAFARGGPVNPNFVPEKQIYDSVASTVARVLQDIDRPIATTVVAGAIPDPCLRPVQESVAGRGHVVRALESEFGLHTEAGLTQAVVVIAGTGSSATAFRADGARAVTGGLGPLLSDEGSAYWIGLEALKACVRSLDGRLHRTKLWGYVCDSLGIDSALQLSRSVYRGDLRRRERIAALSPLVSMAAQEGDFVARTIIGRAAEELALMAVTAARRLELEPEGLTCLCVGGVFRAGPLIVQPLQQALDRLAPGMVARAARSEPITGGLALALGRIGHPLSAERLCALGEAVREANAAAMGKEGGFVGPKEWEAAEPVGTE